MRILVVEDEAIVGESIAEGLEDECYAVDLARDGERASELMAINEYDLVVLDWSIPPPSGIELLRQWRAEGKDAPVLMLSGRAGIRDRVSGLDTGADDYLVKPFDFGELVARVRSLLRRRGRALDPALEAGDVRMDRVVRRVTVAERPVPLTPKEFALLEFFLAHRDEVVTRGELAEHVWDESFDPVSNVIDVSVHRLRKKIDGRNDERLLHTVKGAGYVLLSRRCPPDPTGAPPVLLAEAAETAEACLGRP